MLKVGDRVKMTAQGRASWGNQSDSGEGVVDNLSGRFGLGFAVVWDKTDLRYYREGDVELVSLEATIEAWLTEDRAQEEAQAKQVAGALKLQESFKVDQSKLTWGQRNPRGVGIRQASIHMSDWGR